MDNNTRKPSVGQPVHYVSHGTPVRADGTQEYHSQCRAAIVTAVPRIFPDFGQVDLCVFNPEGLFFKRCNQNTDVPAAGTWHVLHAPACYPTGPQVED